MTDSLTDDTLTSHSGECNNQLMVHQLKIGCWHNKLGKNVKKTTMHHRETADKLSHVSIVWYMLIIYCKSRILRDNMYTTRQKL